MGDGQGTRMLRRGLPRVRGGEPWPEGGVAPVTETVTDAAAPEATSAAPAQSTTAPAASAASEAVPVTEAAAPVSTAPVPAAAQAAAPATTTLRRGLPRTAGGDPWPPASAVTAAAPATASAAAAPAASAPAVPAATAESAPAAASAQTTTPAPTTAPAASAEGAALRRGLPRIDGGEPWPPAGVAASHASTPSAPSTNDIPGSANEPAEVTDVVASATVVENAQGQVVEEVVGSAVVQTAGPDISTPLPFRRTVWPGVAPWLSRVSNEDEGRRGPTWVQVIGGLFAAAGLGILAIAGIFLVRAVLSTPALQDFLALYPGEYEPAVRVEPGFAPWVGWQHFFNMFLMILIIRSGLRVRSEKRPTAFWTPKGNSKGKISLTLWFHQALDLLWIINGVIFVVLLFATGHWARIVPTSWEVIPNAISAGLQYVSLDWPHENGWNNYNSLQQLAYFTTVFLAAPLAVITGFRMSGLWPKKAQRLSKAYPVEWARAVHFPVMLYFVAFIVVHVALVMFTGFLANLGHMYASTEVVGWTGFWVFVASLVVIAAGWFAARPLVIAPIANLFGQVSSR